MNANDEIIEEINDTEETINITDNTKNRSDYVETASTEQVATEVQPEVIYKKKSKAPALIILFILLILDIAAIAIYIIGIDKVLSFIK